MERKDFMKECNNLGSPLEDFKLFFCDRCFQPECTRSNYGKSRFDQRVTTWKERLFTKVPRMEPGDPRFLDITHQQFRPVLDSWEVGSEVPNEEPIPPQPAAFLVEPPSEAILQEVDGSPYLGEGEAVLVEPEVQVRQQVPPRAIPTKKNLEALATMNTPTRTGLYLPGGPQGQPGATIGTRHEVNSGVKSDSRNDSWSAPEQSHPSEVVVEAGATIRLGSPK
jgi:hypothetical protein